MGSKGFTLVEVLVSIVIISLGAMLAFSVTKVVSQKQVQARDAMQYISTSNSIKLAFEEYLYSTNFDTTGNGLIRQINGVYNGNNNCRNYAENSVGLTKLYRNICLAEENLSKITRPNNQNLFKRVYLSITKSTVKNVHYFTNLIMIRDPYDGNRVKFERLFVSQVNVGAVNNQAAPPCQAPCGTP